MQVVVIGVASLITHSFDSYLPKSDSCVTVKALQKSRGKIQTAPTSNPAAVFFFFFVLNCKWLAAFPFFDGCWQFCLAFCIELASIEFKPPGNLRKAARGECSIECHVDQLVCNLSITECDGCCTGVKPATRPCASGTHLLIPSALQVSFKFLFVLVCCFAPTLRGESLRARQIAEREII